MSIWPRPYVHAEIRNLDARTALQGQKNTWPCRIAKECWLGHALAEQTVTLRQCSLANLMRLSGFTTTDHKHKSSKSLNPDFKVVDSS